MNVFIIVVCIDTNGSPEATIFSIWYPQPFFFTREYSNNLLDKPLLKFLFKKS